MVEFANKYEERSGTNDEFNGYARYDRERHSCVCSHCRNRSPVNNDQLMLSDKSQSNFIHKPIFHYTICAAAAAAIVQLSLSH